MVLRHATLEGMYLLAGLAVGLCLVIVQVLKMGAIVPPRGFIFLWVFYGLIALRSLQILTARPGMGVFQITFFFVVNLVT